MANVYNLLSRNFNDTYSDQTEEPSTEVARVYGVVKVEGFAALPCLSGMVMTPILDVWFR